MKNYSLVDVLNGSTRCLQQVSERLTTLTTIRHNVSLLIGELKEVMKHERYISFEPELTIALVHLAAVSHSWRFSEAKDNLEIATGLLRKVFDEAKAIRIEDRRIEKIELFKNVLVVGAVFVDAWEEDPEYKSTIVIKEITEKFGLICEETYLDETETVELFWQDFTANKNRWILQVQ